MSERINVDHAFDPEARKAQADLDAYMDSRAYKDDKGNAHAADGGKFINHEKDHDALREDHYNASLEQGDYSNESLDQLAQRVATARAEGDKTRAADAEEVFFAKFSEYADKYGWENEDDSANGPHVDKDAQLGRSTIDDRLDRYGKIMYAETDADQPEASTKAAEKEDSREDIQAVEEDEQPQESSEADPQIEVEEAEVLPVKSVDEMVEDAKREAATLAAKREREIVTQMNNTEQAKADKALLEPISVEGLDVIDAEAETPDVISTEGLDVIDQPNEDTALEGESLEEYEARHADVSGEELELIEADGLEIIESDTEGDENAQRANWFKRLTTRLSPASLSARAGARMHTTRVAAEKAAEKGDDKERRRKKKALAIGVGVLGVAAAGVGIWLAKESGTFSIDAAPSGGGGGPTGDTVPTATQELFGNGKVEVGSGDGYTQVLDRVLGSKDINLSPNELYELHQHLEQTQGDYIDLAGAGDTYTMENGDSGLSRADKGAQLSDSAQKAAVRWLEARDKL